MSTIAPLLIGFAFGWLLEKAGLAHYERIVNVFRLRDFAVLQFLLSALVTAAIGIRILHGLDPRVDLPVPATYLGGNLLGGLVFGIGMALSGFCPGTVAAGVGEGRLDYLIPGGLGLYAGSVAFGVAYERFMPTLSRWGRMGVITLADWLRVEPWLMVALFAELSLLTFYLVEHVRRPTEARTLLGDPADGRHASTAMHRDSQT